MVLNMFGVLFSNCVSFCPGVCLGRARQALSVSDLGYGRPTRRKRNVHLLFIWWNVYLLLVYL